MSAASRWWREGVGVVSNSEDSDGPVTGSCGLDRVGGFARVSFLAMPEACGWVMEDASSRGVGRECDSNDGWMMEEEEERRRKESMGSWNEGVDSSSFTRQGRED